MNNEKNSSQDLSYQDLVCNNTRVLSRQERCKSKSNKKKRKKGRITTKTDKRDGLNDLISNVVASKERLFAEMENIDCHWTGHHEYGKGWWNQAYLNWNRSEFRRHFRMERKTFDFILDIISPSIQEIGNSKP